MRFRRKTDSTEDSGQEAGATMDGQSGEAPDEKSAPGSGPWDVSEVTADDVERVDLGSLLLQGEPGRDLRLQVDESSGTVQSVLIAGNDGAMDVRAFAAPRHGDLWSEVRPQIAADLIERGGTSTEREGRFGTELVCEAQVQTPDGQPGLQQSRIVGVNGPRWMLRATFIGRPAAEPESARDWEDCLTRVVVRRGDHALPPGEPLPVNLPENARRMEAPPADPRSALATPQEPGPSQSRTHPTGPHRDPAVTPLRRGSRHEPHRRREAVADRAGRPARRDRPSPTRIADAVDRQPVVLEGTLRTVTLRPRGGVPALEAELGDGTGTITVVWLGRRQITGIGAGGLLRVQGRIAVHDGIRIIYNPRYEIVP